MRDYGTIDVAGTATHNLTMYKEPASGALVFGAGTVFGPGGRAATTTVRRRERILTSSSDGQCARGYAGEAWQPAVEPRGGVAVNRHDASLILDQFALERREFDSGPDCPHQRLRRATLGGRLRRSSLRRRWQHSLHGRRDEELDLQLECDARDACGVKRERPTRASTRRLRRPESTINVASAGSPTFGAR